MRRNINKAGVMLPKRPPTFSIKAETMKCALTNASNLDSRAGQGAQGGLGSRARGLGLVASGRAQLDVQGSDVEFLCMI
jgi:hypothetical protein